MQLRPIGPEELDRFAAAGARPELAGEVRAYVDRMIAAGAMRPEWCYLAEVAGTVVGRVAFWTLPTQAKPLDLVLFDAPWSVPAPGVAGAILAEILSQARAFGAEKIGHVVDEPPLPPFWQEEPERRAACLARAGFVLLRETRRFSWDGQHVATSPPARLIFRPIEEVGEKAFVETIAAVSAGSLDQRDQEDRARLGPDGAARDLFADLRGLDRETGWWELAYDGAGAVVGLVMPARIPSGATIGYVGVVPARRGHGYVHDLLTRGMATLQTAGTTNIRADTDVRNAPMAAAFRRAGWVEFATRREFQVLLGG
jgi:RimJ/RimL family protein N-acetyltransferase